MDGEESGEEGAMAKKEESEMVKLMKYMVDRDAEAKEAEADARKAEVKEREEREKREAEIRKEMEEARRADMLELFRQLKGEENVRRREEEELRSRVREESVPKELGDELVPLAVPVEVEAMQECLRESVDEGDDVDGVPVELEKVVESEDECESELRELASQIGPVKVGSDGKDFCQAVLEDESLREWRELGERKERGFAWKKGVLVRSLYITWEEFRDVLVVPKEFRKQIMELGHERNGHLGGEKVTVMVGRYFLWPGMNKELAEHCGSCGLCQLKSKHRP